MLDALKYIRYLQAFNEYVVNELKFHRQRDKQIYEIISGKTYTIETGNNRTMEILRAWKKE